MKPCITVFIQDDNRFFVQGLEFLLRSQLQARGRSVRFVTPAYRAVADLLIQSEHRDWPLHPCRLLAQPGEAALITVRKSYGRKSRSLPPCQSLQGVMGYRDMPSAVALLIEQVLLSQESLPGLPTALCARCAMRLTPREQQVLDTIARGLSQNGVAEVLNVDPKTVSSHKRAAMRKLGFRRNNELYHWLRQGGLELEKRMQSR
ncbi:helix-turn-helix transcriptional regulator [Serratia marcescens]|uniref:helix-turn-helix transcriptional regulator n=1 Tax=Serratia marcescens TaxID=615 RepID=UPI000449AF11|nr:LuxR family transcriptional regulator [Serratia marcescens]EIM8480861.1 hypothetical protein [Serratia marcescens]EIU9509765.1 hypothetical protein [Serratia marcescens]EIV5187694.1 hypothetical protein [Serratia marcescens]ETX44492.1 hypothetical protein P805_01829 [Serratia marcescens BIDMC 44]MBH2621387.1 hypothetical protein [Serratia marcescens]